MAYCSVEELAAALRITVTATNEPTLQACVDAAALEIDDSIDLESGGAPIDPDNPLANRINVLRGVEWFKSNDAAFGVIGFDQTGALRLPKSTFARHEVTLTPLRRQWGIA